MNVPAILFFEPAASPRPLAALTLLDRQVIAAHRAGCSPIWVVCKDALPILRRSQQLGIEVLPVATLPSWQGAALLLGGNVLVQACDVRRLIEVQGRLATRCKAPLPAGIATHWAGSVDESLRHAPQVEAQGIARLVDDEAGAAQAERALWDSMGSATDGVVDRVFNRPAGRPISKLLIHTPVTPNQVSVVATAMGVAAAGLCLKGTHEWLVWGAALLQLSAVVDCVDGELARVLHKETPAGKWVDLVGDQIVHLCLFLALGFGLATRPELASSARTLGIVAAAGAAMSFAVVLLGLLRGEGGGRLQALLDRTTNRDFSVLLLALALADRVHWFLWMAAVGTHVFWMLAWWVQRRDAAAAGLRARSA